ncbi:MobQ family relaxase [Pseudobutyrivibrio xylanivorans]|uniref:MobA/MobL family protein n=1 Tax=Pseudobutyrivibrio xylanivorans TaxID=185007 RepID=A0A5P6VQU7_PSEXY|nr:MobQ family relaxase [Pseudobutyrivibrio xylanivorans]QFJ53534.1 MobA/MobL family protein [Pseudobutyrivibrio xylanivorans]
MALYHFHVTQVSRGKGQSATATDAYITGERIHDDYYGKIHDYTKKEGVLFKELLLPDYAPERLRDRETLFNEIERIEKHPKAQLCYNFNFALQNELTYEENLEIAQRFIKENFLAKGMIVDYAVHNPDRDGGIPNPHVHMLIPIRPLNKDGTWGEKQKREYLLDENGERIKKTNGKYVFNAVPTTDWGSPETLNAWRKAYADIFNKAFEDKGLSCKIDNRSYAEQGLDILPTVHEGPHVRAMEAKGIRTEIGDENRRIKAFNEMITKLSTNLQDLFEWLSDFLKSCHKQKIYVPSLGELVNDYYSKRNDNAWSRKGKTKNLKAHAKTILFLTQNNISSMEELTSFVRKAYRDSDELSTDISRIDDRIKDIKKAFRYLEMYAKYKPVYDKQFTFKLKRNHQKYKDEHCDELNRYHLAKRMLDNFWCGQQPNWSVLKNELVALEKKRTDIALIYDKCHDTAVEAYQIKKIAEEMMRMQQEDVHVVTRKRNHDMER